MPREINAPIGINAPEIKPSDIYRAMIKTPRDQCPMGSIYLAVIFCSYILSPT